MPTLQALAVRSIDPEFRVRDLDMRRQAIRSRWTADERSLRREWAMRRQAKLIAILQTGPAAKAAR